jgi:hypothetical protein
MPDRGTTTPDGTARVCRVAATPRLPDFVNWPSFPFEGQLRVKRLEVPVADEPPREGEDPNSCSACNASDDSYVWVSDRWRVRSMDRPSGLPMVLVLESRSHLDMGDLTNLLAAELGVMTVRLERAIRSLDGVERVHVNRWGDGAAHLHLWFLARPTGYVQLRGSFLSMWDDILEPISEDLWRENLALVGEWLGDFGGRVVAVPPRIEWHAPSRFEEDGTLAVRENEDVDFPDAVDSPLADRLPSAPEVVPAPEAAPATGSETPNPAQPAGTTEAGTAPAAANGSAPTTAGGEPIPAGVGGTAPEAARPPAQKPAVEPEAELADWGLSDDELSASDILAR